MDSLSKLKELCNSGNTKSLNDFLTSCADCGNTQWVIDAAERGDSDAQFALSELYRLSEEEDNQTAELAFSWAMKSADQGNILALSNLGKCYKDGTGTEKDDVAAFQCYLKAAEGGKPDAQDIVGDFYSEGIGTEKDFDEAIKWYEKAADNGVTHSMISLVYFYWGSKFGRNYRIYKLATKKLEEFHQNKPDDDTIQFWFYRI